MCGICGIVNFNHDRVHNQSLNTMMESMKHRGPDDKGVFIDDHVGFGFVRLSILDLSLAGHQPMESADKSYVIVFNGEIYNYLELRNKLIKKGHHFSSNTDTEVLLTAYKEWGEDCLNYFNGMWSFAIYDKDKKHVFAARDRFGIKPFYYVYNDDQLIFASEIPPILKLLKSKPKPNYQAIFDFLVFNRTDQTDDTFFRDIKKMQHGCKMSVTDKNIEISQWYNLKERVANSEKINSADEFRQLFSSSIELHLRSDVPVGVCFSGGLDSSSIVSVLLSDYNKTDLNTFSAVYNKGQIGDESEFIREYNPFLSNMHFTTPDANSLIYDLNNFVKAHAEPIPSTSPYAQFKVMKLAQGKVVVTLDGQGADEELAGYHYFFGFYFKELLRKFHLLRLSKEVCYYLKKHKSLYGIKSFLFFLLPASLRTQARLVEKDYLKKDFILKYRHSNKIASKLYGSETLNDALINHFEYKMEHLLKWEDRNSMWHSLEARVPFLDYRLVERVLATSSDKIICKGETKYLLRESMYGILPEKIRLRNDKIGFETPQDEWFKTAEWEQLIKDILTSESFKKRNIIDPVKAISHYNNHLVGKVNISREIWKWIHLELWFRTFIDKSSQNI